MVLNRWDPFAELEALHNQVNNVFAQRSAHDITASPVTDIYKQDDNQLVVEVHLPNFTQEDISVTCKDHALEISAIHNEKEEDKKRDYMVRESSSQFYR